MGLRDYTCPNCGSSITVETNKNQTYCEYCGAYLFLQEGKATFVNNQKDTLFRFDGDERKDQKEDQGKHKSTKKTHDNFEKNKFTTRSEYSVSNSQPIEKKKKTNLFFIICIGVLVLGSISRVSNYTNNRENSISSGTATTQKMENDVNDNTESFDGTEQLINITEAFEIATNPGEEKNGFNDETNFTYSFSDYECSIPSYLEKTESDSIIFKEKTHNTTILFLIDLHDMSEGLKLTNYAFYLYMDDYVNSFVENVEGGELFSRTNLIINDMPAVVFTLTSRPSNIDYYTYSSIMYDAENKRLISFTFGEPQNGSMSYVNDFSKILNSIHKK